MAKMRFPEDDLQMATARYLDLISVAWFHVANERKTTKRAGVRLKRKGVKAGVPDVLIFEPKGKFNGLAIELKIKPNSMTLDQKHWFKRLQMKGWYCKCCYNIDEVIDIVESYLHKEV